MSIAGYLAPGRPVGASGLRLGIRGGLAGNGITVEGPVLEGRMTVDEAMVLSWIRGVDTRVAIDAGCATVGG